MEQELGEVKYNRAVLLIGSFVYIIFVFLDPISHTARFNEAWIRFVILAPCYLGALLSYFYPIRAERLRQLVVLGFCIIATHVFCLLYFNPNFFPVLIGVFVMVIPLNLIPIPRRSMLILAFYFEVLAITCATQMPKDQAYTFVLSMTMSLLLVYVLSYLSFRALRELHLSRAELSAVLGSTDDLIYTVDNNLNVQIFNQALVKYMRYHKGKELKKGMSIFEFMSSNRKRLIAEHTYLALNGETQLFEFDSETVEGVKSFEMHMHPLMEENVVRGVTVFCHNITERKRQSEIIKQQRLQLEMSTRLSALGEMASGIAHEINNPLAIIIGFNEEIAKYLSESETANSLYFNMSKKIHDHATRIAKVVSNLKSLSRDENRDPFIQLNLKKLVDSAMIFYYERAQADGIQIKLNIPDNIFFEGKESDMSKLLLNFISNAIDAVQTLNEKWIEIQGFQTGEVIKLWITDSGAGIPLGVQRKIMQPFFTTKDIGKGSGLGLTISRKILESHKGEVYIDNDCPNTRFVITLPASQVINDSATSPTTSPINSRRTA